MPGKGAIIFYQEEGPSVCGGGPEFFGVAKGGTRIFSVGPRGDQNFFEGHRGGDQNFFSNFLCAFGGMIHTMPVTISLCLCNLSE